MNIEDFMRRVEHELGWEAGSLKPDTRLDGVSRWDSMAVLMVIAFVDAELGKTVAGISIRACRTVGELHALVESLPSKG